MEVVPAHFCSFTFFKLTSNQLFVVCNIEVFFSCPSQVVINIIMPSNLYKFLLVMVKVDLRDIVFFIVDDSLNHCNLLFRVKFVTLTEIVFSWITWLPVTKGDAKFKTTKPLYLGDGQVSELLQNFFCNLCHVWNCQRTCHIFNCFVSNYAFAHCDRLKHLLFDVK